jgi:hypothetical protein
VSSSVESAKASEMPRWKNKRDANHLEIFRALQKAGRNPIHGRDVDIFCGHVEGYGIMIEAKVIKGTLRPIQKSLQELFGNRYFVIRSVDEALAACGVQGLVSKDSA